MKGGENPGCANVTGSGSGRGRTSDAAVFNRALYRLSYRSVSPHCTGPGGGRTGNVARKRRPVTNIGAEGFEPSCDLLSFQRHIRPREYAPVESLGIEPSAARCAKPAGPLVSTPRGDTAGGIRTRVLRLERAASSTARLRRRVCSDLWYRAEPTADEGRTGEVSPSSSCHRRGGIRTHSLLLMRQVPGPFGPRASNRLPGWNRTSIRSV